MVTFQNCSSLFDTSFKNYLVSWAHLQNSGGKMLFYWCFLTVLWIPTSRVVMVSNSFLMNFCYHLFSLYVIAAFEMYFLHWVFWILRRLSLYTGLGNHENTNTDSCRVIYTEQNWMYKVRMFWLKLNVQPMFVWQKQMTSERWQNKFITRWCVDNTSGLALTQQRARPLLISVCNRTISVCIAFTLKQTRFRWLW